MDFAVETMQPPCQPQPAPIRGGRAPDLDRQRAALHRFLQRAMQEPARSCMGRGEIGRARLAVLFPSPRKNLVTYHGVLAANAAFRPEIIPPPKGLLKGL